MTANYAKQSALLRGSHLPKKIPLTFPREATWSVLEVAQQTRAEHETGLESQVNSFVSPGSPSLHRSVSDFF